MKNTKKIVAKKTYTFEIIHYEDGTSAINRKNDGFSVIEMIGISEIMKETVMGVFKNAIKTPTKTTIKSKNAKLINK